MNRRRRIWISLNPNIVAQYERSLLVLCPTCKQPPGEMCVKVRFGFNRGEVSNVPHQPRIKKSWKLKEINHENT